MTRFLFHFTADLGITDIRLVGGETEDKGRVEVKIRNTWGTVCNDSFDSKDARVICNTLNYTYVFMVLLSFRIKEYLY